MPSVNTLQIIQDAREELKIRVAERGKVEKRIAELRIMLRTLVRFMPNEGERLKILIEIEEARKKAPSLTDSISELLKQSESGLSGNEMRDALEQAGFDLDDYSQPLAAIMTSVGRLIEQKRVTRYQSKNGPVLFKWTSDLHDLYASGMRGDEKPRR